MIYIYTISTPEIGIFYIGQSKQFEVRMLHHLTSKGMTEINIFIRKLKSENKPIEFDVLDIVSDGIYAWSVEMFWINQFKRSGIKLKNTYSDKPHHGFVFKRWNMIHPSVKLLTRSA